MQDADVRCDMVALYGGAVARRTRGRLARLGTQGVKGNKCHRIGIVTKSGNRICGQAGDRRTRRLRYMPRPHRAPLAAPT